jgi:hypothetical protein
MLRSSATPVLAAVPLSIALRGYRVGSAERTRTVAGYSFPNDNNDDKPLSPGANTKMVGRIP